MTSTINTSPKLPLIYHIGMPEFLAAAVFLTTFDLPGTWWFEPLQVYLRGVLCCALLLMICIRRKPGAQFLLTSAFFAMIACLTLFRQTENIPYMATRLSGCFLVALMLEYERMEKESLLRCLSTLRILLIIVCLLDALTMVLFPSGMYTSGAYTINWFLGYKTARMAYLLPMMALTAYLSEIKHGGMRGTDWLLFLTGIVQTFYSQAAGAALTLLLFAVLVFTHRKKETVHCHTYAALIAAAAVNIFVLTSEDNPVLQYIIQDLLHKTPTLSNRTMIWEACLEKIREHPLFGSGMLTTGQYKTLTDFALGTNAHNMALTLLVTTGAIGLLLYLVILVHALYRRDGAYRKTDAAMYYAVVVMLIVGITSSAMIFSTYAFLPMMLAACGREKSKERSKENGYGMAKLHLAKRVRITPAP